MIQKIQTEDGLKYALILEDCNSLSQLVMLRNSLQNILTEYLDNMISLMDVSNVAYACDLSSIIKSISVPDEMSNASWGLIEKIAFPELR